MVELRSRFQEQVVEGMAIGTARWKTGAEIEQTGAHGGGGRPILFGEYEVTPLEDCTWIDIHRRMPRRRHKFLWLKWYSTRYEFIARVGTIPELYALFKADQSYCRIVEWQQDLDDLDAALLPRRTT